MGSMIKNLQKSRIISQIFTNLLITRDFTTSSIAKFRKILLKDSQVYHNQKNQNKR